MYRLYIVCLYFFLFTAEPLTRTRLVDFCRKLLESTQLQFVQDKFIKNIVVEWAGGESHERARRIKK